MIELLVVVAIIVILLAVLIPGLQKALTASERARCATNQRNIAQQCAIYANDYKRFMPPRGNVLAGGAIMYLSANTAAKPQPAANIIGLGFLSWKNYLPQTALGEIGHCPSLDTTSAAGVKIGMNEQEWGAGLGLAAGHWGLQCWVTTDVSPTGGSYHYRGVSHHASGRGNIRTSKAESSFVLISDMLDKGYGVKFHHLTGYNRAFADGSTSFFPDPPYATTNPADPESNVERVPGNAKYPYPDTVTNKNAAARGFINGTAGATATIWHDEAIFNFMSSDKVGFKF